MSPSTANADRPKPAPKPLHPAVYGCLVVGILALGLGGLAIYQASQKLREMSDVMQDFRSSEVRPELERVTGGVVHGAVSSPDSPLTLGAAWRGSDRLTFVELLSFKAASGSMRPVVPWPFESRQHVQERSRRVSDQINARMRPRCVMQYDFGTGARMSVVEFPAQMFSDGAGMAWNSGGTRLAVWLRALDGVGLAPSGPSAVTLYVTTPGAQATWTAVTELTKPECTWLPVAWSPDDTHLAFGEPQGSGQWDVYCVPVAGGEPRLMGTACDWFRWGCPGSDAGTLYLGNENGIHEPYAKVRARRVSVPDGAASDVTIRDLGLHPGALRDTETPVAELQGASWDRLQSRVGALDLQTGELRWVAQGIEGGWHASHGIASGSAILLVPWAQTPGNQKAGAVATRDGHFTEVGGLKDTAFVDANAASPDGNRVVLGRNGQAGTARSRGRTYLQVLDFMYPQEVLGTSQ